VQATTRKLASIGGSGARLSRGAALLGSGAVLLLVLGASPARADDHFERGFETELGRIAAHSIVQIGHNLLVHGYTPYVSYGSHGVVYQTPYSSFRYGQRPIVIHHSDHHRLSHHRSGYRFGHVVTHGHGKNFGYGYGHGGNHRHGRGCRH
jgi:hypothetical protein